MTISRAGMAIIVFAGLLLYARVTTAWFCGYDDFMETHRARFEDTAQPSRIFTTTHFDSPKYRPLNRALTYLCWRLGGGSPLPFRVRNLIFHLIAALLLCSLGFLLTGDRTTAFVAGLLFCINPLANQNVSAAIFTNTAELSVLLGALLLFIRSLHFKERWSLSGALLLALIGLFLYESVIVVFGVMAAYLVLWRLQKGAIPRLWLTQWITECAAVLAIFFAVRHTVVTLSSGIAPLSTIAHNALVYTAALLSPVDPVLSSAVFGTSLPPDIHPNRAFLIRAVSAGIAVLVLVVLFLRTAAGRRALARLDGGLILFLVVSIFVALSPVLAFAPHPSETYLYLPAALYCILLSLVLRAFLTNRLLYISAVSLLTISFMAGVWVRNQRVTSCGVIARRIMDQLPVARWTRGPWSIHLATTPGQVLLPRYGVYGYNGIATIDPSEPGTPSAQKALQIATGNEQLHADVVSAGGMKSDCATPASCFWISADGSVREVALSPSTH